jgi:hypothetical protein
VALFSILLKAASALAVEVDSAGRAEILENPLIKQIRPNRRLSARI